MNKLDGNVCDGCRKLVPYPLIKGLCCQCRVNTLGFVDNFDIIKSFTFDFSNEFYFIQIISRTKDGGTGDVIKSYYLNRNEIESFKSDIIDFCRKFKARAYIQLNPCSYTKIQFEMLKKLTNYLESGCNKIHGICDSACGTAYNKMYWIVDIDEKNWNLVQEVHYLINQCDSKYSNEMLNAIPTISGWHLVVFPFKLDKFYQLLEINHLDKYEVKNQAMTLLYCDLRSI